MTNDRDIPDACRKLERYFEEIQDARSENYHKIYHSTCWKRSAAIVSRWFHWGGWWDSNPRPLEPQDSQNTKRGNVGLEVCRFWGGQ